MKTAIYLRVSTNHQTTDNQIPDIENYLESHSIAATDVTWYRENETAWTQGHTAELAKLKEEIRSGKRKFELFIVWAFDRLTREGSIALIREYDFFIRHGVKVISIKEGWSDVPKEFTPVMLAMFGYLAEMESKQLYMLVLRAS